MNNRSVDYMLTHDIDWYFRAGLSLYHCASNGGLLPVSCRGIKEINNLKAAVRELPQIYGFDDIDINNEYVATVVGRQVEIWQTIADASGSNDLIPDDGLIRDLLLSSFMDMACRGFISMDRLESSGKEIKITDKDYYEDYIIIAEPKKGMTPIQTEIVVPDLSSLIRIDGKQVRISVNNG